MHFTFYLTLQNLVLLFSFIQIFSIIVSGCDYMKKILIILVLLITLIVTTLISYNIVQANHKVTEELSLVTTQNEINKKITTYGYTFENPNIIINPYEISPLTAIILFETKKQESITITIKGKDNLTTYTHTFEPTDKHYIPVYGLYPNYNNEIIITTKTSEKTINIQTSPLPEDFILPTNIIKDEKHLTNDLYFYTPSAKGYTCAYDTNGDVRWYLTKKFIWEISRLKNGHLLLSTDSLVNVPYYTTGLVEIDLLGKIYYEYVVDGGYHHDYFEMPNGNILVLSDNFSNGTVEDYIVEIDRKNGLVVNTIDLTTILPQNEGLSANSTEYDWFHNNSVWYDEETNQIILSGRHQDIVVSLNYSTKKINYIIGDPNTWSSEYQKYFLTPTNDLEWSYAQHAAKMLPNGDIFLFDNGVNRSKNKNNYIPASENYSRGVIYRVNQDNMTITQIYEYGKNRGSNYYSPYISDVDYLNTNHYLIHSGGISYKNSEILNVPAALGNADMLKSITTEILNDQVIFELQLPTNNYRCEKMPLYTKDNYRKTIGVTLGSFNETETSSTNVSLIKYKNKNNTYDKYNISLIKQPHRLAVTGTFTKEDKVKIILDKFLGKKTYDFIISTRPYTAMCVDIFTNKDPMTITKYINEDGLKGKYSIYIMINNIIYKTDNYVIF